MNIWDTVYCKQKDKKHYCGECGRVIKSNEDIYECRTHSLICEDCLKMLHKKYV
jgi:hypothetical protein